MDITKKELEHLERLGSGTFGAVYKKDSKYALKVYFPEIKDEQWNLYYNPSLKLPKRRYKELIRRSKYLKYTGGVLDMLYVDGEFSGVVVPFYEGKTLSKMIDAPLEDKLPLAKQLVRNSKELSRHFIYPTDYKLNNMINHNGNIELIDLDDVRTHVCYKPSIIFRSISLGALNETIQTFFKEYIHLYFPKNIEKKLGRAPANFTIKYKTIEGYINKKMIPRDFLVINKDTDFEEVSKLTKDKDYAITYIIDKPTDDYREYELLLYELEDFGINLYDITTQDRFDCYNECEMINSISYIENHQLIKK